MRLTQAIGSNFRRYFDFKGRSSRSEYWWWILFVVFVNYALVVLENVIGSFDATVRILFISVALLPSIAVSVRRLHDRDKSGWLLLIVLIPFIGIIWAVILLIWFASPGDEGYNRYGANPLHP